MTEQLLTRILVKLDALEQDLQNIKNGQARIEANIDRLEAKIDKVANEQQADVFSLLQVIDEKISSHTDMMTILSRRSLEQEAEINKLKRGKIAAG